MTQHLVITAMGTDRPICNQVVHLVTQAGCNIIDSRIAMFGNEFTLIMLLSGSSNGIARVETTLPLLGQEQDLITIMKRTSPHNPLSNCYTLEVFIESDDRVGLTEQFTQFLLTNKLGCRCSVLKPLINLWCSWRKISSTLRLLRRSTANAT